MIQVKPLAQINIDKLYESWEDAFSDYVSTLNKVELKRMLKRRGYSAELSFGAFDDDKLVSFTLNGVGTHGGRKTAYDTGTGTIKEYRGRGLVKKVFIESLPYLKQAGMEQYLLEVLQDNAPAISIYTGVGFQTTREFCYFIKPTNEVSIKEKTLPNDLEIKRIDSVMEREMSGMWDVQPSWQNNFDAVKSSLNDFIILGAYKTEQLVGYGIVEPASGDITQLAVQKEYRRQGIASSIFKQLVAKNKADIVKVINVESTCNFVISFLAHHDIEQSGMQYEMLREVA